MAKIIIVFASMTGNTEEIANLIGKGVKEVGAELTVHELPNGEAKELQDYDGILLGSYTYGDGDLADEFADFYDELNDVNLEGKLAAVFGSGDTAYEYFCSAVDILSDKLTERGAVIALEGLKIELAPEDEGDCITFGKNFAEQVRQVITIK